MFVEKISKHFCAPKSPKLHCMKNLKLMLFLKRVRKRMPDKIVGLMKFNKGQKYPSHRSLFKGWKWTKKAVGASSHSRAAMCHLGSRLCHVSRGSYYPALGDVAHFEPLLPWDTCHQSGGLSMETSWLLVVGHVSSISEPKNPIPFFHFHTKI